MKSLIGGDQFRPDEKQIVPGRRGRVDPVPKAAAIARLVIDEA